MTKNLKDKKNKQTNKQTKNIELTPQGLLVSNSMRCMEAFFKKLMALLLLQYVKNLKQKQKSRPSNFLKL